jgi:predicted phage terminase large subunit-like protein
MATVFPEFKLNPDRQAVHEWETAQGGGYRAVGIGGGLTGTGADILLIDDPIKNAMEANSRGKRENDWEWYQTTGYTRLMPGAGVLVIQTRWHEDDLSGRLLEAMKTGEGDDWEIIVYPAIAEKDEEHRKIGEALHPDRYNLDKLQRIRKAIGLRAWTALYQQNPSPEEGTLFKKHWWKLYKKLPSRFARSILSWDTTFKGGENNDFVVGFGIGKIGADYYVFDRYKEQADYVESVPAIKSQAERFPDARPVLIEDKANGPAIISSLKGKVPGVIPFDPEGSKESRANVAALVAEGGNIHLPEDAPWLEDFIEEFKQFPKGKHDDQVDALSQGIIYLEEEGKMAVFEGIPAAFGDPPAYPAEDWSTVMEGPRQIYIGAKWGVGAPHAHTFYALGVTGATMGYKRIETSNHAIALESLKDFARGLSKGAQATVFYESTGFGETMGRLITEASDIDWRTEPFKLTPVDCDTMIAFLKISFTEKKVALKPWAALFDQMCAFRSERTPKDTLIYGPPPGLSANAVFALVLAHEGWRKFGGEKAVIVVNQIENTLQRIYYGSGDLDDYE